MNSAAGRCEMDGSVSIEDQDCSPPDTYNEELESLSNSPEESTSIGGQVGHSETDELLSLSNSPEESTAIITGYSDVIQDEELPSLSDSSGSTNLPSVSNNVLNLSSSHLESERPSTSSAVSASVVASASKEQYTAIRSFRTRIDENGETIFEFASDDGEPDSDTASEAGAVVDVTPTPEELDRNLQEQRNIIRTLQAARYQRPTETQTIPHFESGSELSDSSEDSDYRPSDNQAIVSLGGVGQRVAGRHGQRLGPHISAEQVRTTANRRRRRVKPGRRRKKARATKKKVAKPKSVKIRKPPKPLVPKIIIENLDGNEGSKFYKPQLSRNSTLRNRTTIHFDNEQATTCEVESPISFVKVGEIFLDVSSNQELQWPNKEQLLKSYVGLKDFILYSSTEYRNIALIELKTEERLSEEESALRPKPKLNTQDKKRKLIFVLRKSYIFTCAVEEYPLEMFCTTGFGSKKSFRLDFIGYNAVRDRMQLDISINKSIVLEAHDLSAMPYVQNKMQLEIFSTLFNIPKTIDKVHDDAPESQKEDIPWFYGQIKKYHDAEMLPSPTFSLQPDSIVPILRPYQKRAVHWMLYKEGVLTKKDAEPDQNHVDLGETFLKKMYIPVTLGGQSAFYNAFVGYFCWSLPSLAHVQSGGILADEMGLGKTVEVICLILLNPRPSNEYEDVDYNSSDIIILSNHNSSDEEPSYSRKNSERKNSKKKRTLDEKAHKKKEPAKTKAKRRRILQVSSSDASESDSDESFTLSKNDDSDSDDIKPHAVRKNRSTTDPEHSSMLHPRFRKRRNVSPCTFHTDEHEKPQSENCDIESNRCIISLKVASAEPSSSKKRGIQHSSLSKNEVSNKRKKETPTPVKGGTYAVLKAMYEEELFSYSESMNTSKTVFGGTFFETNIMRRACFECICGETKTRNDRRQIVECTACQSSQHADCVGFDKPLQRLYNLRKWPYLCPHCAVLQEPFHAKTTLIVTPTTISTQWINELKRHVKKQAMQILFYKGVSQHGYIPPSKLAAYDLVITSYNVLAVELNYVDLPHLNSEDGRRFRNPKRFMTIPSPLPCVFWWRVCLDEAQMVEGINTKMSLMAMRLPSVHRWCITGTPVNEGLQDLFGLYAFLGIEPICVDFWWKKLVQEPFYKKDANAALYELLGTIWRMNKNDVLSELGIPPQKSVVRWLNFSAVEEHFYKQQYEICSKKILEKIARLRQGNNDILQSRLSSLDRQILQSLLQPFLELRKACCHPQIVKGQTISLQKGTMTMEELLAQLLKKSSLQCSEDHRRFVASLNGMAGIHMIREEWFTASEAYRQVLQSAQKYKEHFPTDTLQLLHTMENLADLLDRNHEGIPYTLRDSSLRSEAEELKKKYMEKYADGVKTAQHASDLLTKVTDELSMQFRCTGTGASWWITTLSKAARLGKGEDLVKRIKDELIGVVDVKSPKVISLAHKFDDAFGLERVLVEQILRIENLRKSSLEGVSQLEKEDPSLFVDAAVSCHLRKKSQLYYKESDALGFRCQICRYHDKFIEYESLLFKEVKKHKVIRTGRKWQQQKLMGTLSTELTEEEQNLVLLKEEEELIESLEHVTIGLSDELRRGTWGDSDTERALKLINNFARVNKLPEDVRHDGSTHIKLYDSMKKEFRVLRVLWMKIYDQISAVDELSQATTRLCLKADTVPPTQSGENAGPSTSSGSSSRRKKKPKELQSTQIEQDQRIQNINVLERHELDMKMTEMEVERESGKESLSVHMGQLLYLETLKKTDYSKKGNINSEDCPVCHNQLGREWTVLRCGHSYCSDCVKAMCPNVQKSFLCPLCRHSMKYSDVSFIDNRRPEEVSPSKAVKKQDIKGSHSTKVEAILETLLELQDSHPGEKVIIFSTWVDVLEITAKALTQNDIRNCLLNQSGKKFQTELERFKTREDVQVLLMPLVSGAKGLNIIEATHILLVEPILSLASELQAIGRIHRIGQTKPTFVHRFYIKNTVEEQLFEVLKTHDVSSDTEGALTVADLQNLINDGKNYSGPNEIVLE